MRNWWLLPCRAQYKPPEQQLRHPPTASPITVSSIKTALTIIPMATQRPAYDDPQPRRMNMRQWAADATNRYHSEEAAQPQWQKTPMCMSIFPPGVATPLNLRNEVDAGSKDMDNKLKALRATIEEFKQMREQQQQARNRWRCIRPLVICRDKNRTENLHNSGGPLPPRRTAAAAVFPLRPQCRARPQPAAPWHTYQAF